MPPPKTARRSSRVAVSLPPHRMKAVPAIAQKVTPKTQSFQPLAPKESLVTFLKNSLFPIVGIGASAGGLEAFTKLLEHLPADTGMAFVLVQHLAPKHESMLTELLSRASKMPVEEVRDGIAVKPDQVYVIPPNVDMAIVQDVLRLIPRPEGHG